MWKPPSTPSPPTTSRSLSTTMNGLLVVLLFLDKGKKKECTLYVKEEVKCWAGSRFSTFYTEKCICKKRTVLYQVCWEK